MCDHCGCRAMPPIAELSAEHEAIRRLAWDLAEAVRAGDLRGAGSAGQLLDLLDVHVAKEETGHYPALLAGQGLAPPSTSVEDWDRVAGAHRAAEAAAAVPSP